METKMSNAIKGFAVVVAMAGCLAIGIWHGESIGEAKATEKTAAEFNAKAVIEYELGYDAGYKDALYQRPVSEELEMVCLGLWVASLPEYQ